MTPWFKGYGTGSGEGHEFKYHRGMHSTRFSLHVSLFSWVTKTINFGNKKSLFAQISYFNGGSNL
jgi:hypothetical protein